MVPFSTVSDLGTLSVYQKVTQDFESYKTIVEKSILPTNYSDINQIDAQILVAISLMVVGFLTIFILEKIGNKVK